MRRTIVFAAAAFDVFKTLTEAQVVRVALERATPDEKLTMEMIAAALDIDPKQAKRGVRTALDNETLIVVTVQGRPHLRTYAIGPSLAGLVWGHSVTAPDNNKSQTTELPLSDRGRFVPSRVLHGEAL